MAGALKAMGGDMQCKLYFRNDDERRVAEEASVDVNTVYLIDDLVLVRSDDVFFAATDITNGELLRGVRYTPNGAETESVVMRSKTGAIRYIGAVHHGDKLSRIGLG